MSLLTRNQIVEALLFTSTHALPLKKIVEFLEEYSSAQIKEAIQELNREYEQTGRIFRVVPVGDGFQLRTLPECQQWIKKMDTVRTIKLSQTTLETLSIIAYNQPTTRAQIESIRGVDSSYTLRNLLQKKLIKIVGKEEVPGRPSLYGTTKLFLEVFGLKDVKNLPSLSELDMEEKTDATPAPVSSLVDAANTACHFFQGESPTGKV
ncbi:SMC-Scp complex subunit ScpB [Deltaproteobacteria bacterium TL4]